MAKETATAAPTTPPNQQSGDIKLPDDLDKHINDPHAPATPAPPTGNQLSPKQVARAAVEAFQVASPQPTPEEVQAVLEKLNETDDKGQPKHKFEKAVDAAKAAVQAANELRKGGGEKHG